MHRFLSTVAAIVVATSTLHAYADSIAGPTLFMPSAGYTVSGIGFIANVNSTIDSFAFQNEGLADTVILLDSMGNVIDSISTPAGHQTENVVVDWSLMAGQQYYLLQTTKSNSYYGEWGLAAPVDTQLSLTQTYIFAASTNPANFYLKGTDIWAAFSNITTTSDVSSTPEPSSIMLLGTGLLGTVAFVRKKRD
jgi:hypothetical protein